MDNSMFEELVNKFLSLIFSTFQAKQHYLDLKVHYDEKCDDIINPELINRRKELIRVCNKLKVSTESARLKYNSLNNSLNKFCYSLSKSDLKKIIEYFDYTINNINSKKQIINLIINYIIDDIKAIYLYRIKNNEYRGYEGPITLIYAILNRKEVAKQCIKSYREIEKRIIEVEQSEQIHKISRLKLNNEISTLESSLLSSLFKKDLIEKLYDEKFEKSRQLRELEIEKALLIEKFEKLKIQKNNSYEDYKNISLLIPKLINKLGEKSLKELIQYLNINIVIPEDNYFDEKEEMRKQLKKWFYLESKNLKIKFNEEDSVVIDYGGRYIVEPQKMLRKK